MDVHGRTWLAVAARLALLDPSLREVPARVDGPAPTPSGVVRLAVTARARLADDPAVDPGRRRWLDTQLAAAAVLADDSLGWGGKVRHALGVEPALGSVEGYAAARAAVSDLLPGTGGVRERWAAWRSATTVEDVLVTARGYARRLSSLPVELVATTGPARAVDTGAGTVVHLPVVGVPAGTLPWRVAHEGGPGHALQQARNRGTERAATVRATPGALLAEGLAQVALTSVTGPRWAVWAGLDVVHEAIAEARRPLDGLLADACVLLHDRGASAETVRDHLLRHGLGDERAAQSVIAFGAGPGRLHGMTYAAGRDRAVAALTARSFSELLDDGVL